MAELLLVNTEDLRGHVESVLAGLSQGKPFILLDTGHPLAQVLALTPPALLPPAPTLPSALVCQLDACLSLLGETTISRIIGLTLPSVLHFRATGQSSEAARARLCWLNEALGVQQADRSRASITAWWRMRQRELGGISPTDYLALPWTPGDKRSDAVFGIIKRDSLLRQLPNSLGVR